MKWNETKRNEMKWNMAAEMPRCGRCHVTRSGQIKTNAVRHDALVFFCFYYYYYYYYYYYFIFFILENYCWLWLFVVLLFDCVIGISLTTRLFISCLEFVRFDSFLSLLFGLIVLVFWFLVFFLPFSSPMIFLKTHDVLLNSDLGGSDRFSMGFIAAITSSHSLKIFGLVFYKLAQLLLLILFLLVSWFLSGFARKKSHVMRPWWPIQIDGRTKTGVLTLWNIWMGFWIERSILVGLWSLMKMLLGFSWCRLEGGWSFWVGFLSKLVKFGWNGTKKLNGIGGVGRFELVFWANWWNLVEMPPKTTFLVDRFFFYLGRFFKDPSKITKDSQLILEILQKSS